MYNKLFTKILDSSIWLESNVTRIVWLTLIASMNEDGFCAFASTANLAHRAIVPLQEAKEAISVLESPDENSADKSNEGRRIERVPGGWMVLNAPKYQAMVTRAIVQEQTRIRVADFRAKKKRDGNGHVTECNAGVTQRNAKQKSVTPSDTDTYSESETNAKQNQTPQGGILNANAVTECNAGVTQRNARLLQYVDDREAERKVNFAGADLQKALERDMRAAAMREGLSLTEAKVIYKTVLEYATLPWIDTFDSQQELNLDITAEMAAHAIMQELLINDPRTLTVVLNAVGSFTRHNKDKHPADAKEIICALWREYSASDIHAKCSFRTWIGQSDNFLSPDSWRKKPKEEKPKHNGGFKAATPTPKWADTRPRPK